MFSDIFTVKTIVIYSFGSKSHIPQIIVSVEPEVGLIIDVLTPVDVILFVDIYVNPLGNVSFM